MSKAKKASVYGINILFFSLLFYTLANINDYENDLIIIFYTAILGLFTITWKLNKQVIQS